MKPVDEIEFVNGTAAMSYLPNGNPAPGSKFDYKLRWFERLTGYAKSPLGERRSSCFQVLIIVG
jgi:exodeoxyribonuclease-3